MSGVRFMISIAIRAIVRGQDVVPHVAERFDRDVQYVRLITDHQCLVVAGVRFSTGDARLVCGYVQRGQVEMNRRALADLRFQRNIAVALLHQSIYRLKPMPVPLPGALAVKNGSIAERRYPASCRGRYRPLSLMN